MNGGAQMGAEEIKNLFNELSPEEMEKLEIVFSQLLKNELDKGGNLQNDKL